MKTYKKKRAQAETSLPVRPYVLVTNDDGIVAPGIAALICALQPTCDLCVVAPDGPRSGAACSITCAAPLSYHLVSEEPGMKAFACSGTPVDCVKLALQEVCERKPDLIVSGINHGNNASICTFYSGTMGAVIEGCIKGIPSIGFSLATFEQGADFSPCTTWIQQIVQHVLQNSLPLHTFLNVNFPAIPEIKGLKVCRQAMGDWVHEFAPLSCPRPGNWFWLTGEYANRDKGRDHDMAALSAGYASVVPQRLDMTDHDALQSLSALSKKPKTNKTKNKQKQ